MHAVAGFAAMKLKFHTLDVFTRRRFAGNPLAVVLGADELSTEQMQTITREFNLSETVFILKPDHVSSIAKARIFFPGGEMPFAGHPTVGMAVLLAELRNGTDKDFEADIALELKAGLTPVRVTRRNGFTSARLVAPKLPFLSHGDVPDGDAVAKALHISIDDIGFERHELALTRGAIGFLCVPVKSRDVLARVKIIEPHWSAIVSGTHDLDAAYVYARGGDAPETNFRARMFAPTGGIAEDPATGSATVQMAAQLLAAERLGDGRHTWLFEQGYEMGRPSDLMLEADVVGGRLSKIWLAGEAVRVSEGELVI
jgi:trans-2,3-dihydro-3-hydroxyanthranilate isomerase